MTTQRQRHADTRNMNVGQESQVVIPSTGDVNPDDFREDFEVVEDLAALRKNKLETMAFLEEYIEVVVAETDDEKADPIPSVSVNGISQYFIRGMVQKVRRKFVQELARCKIGVISTPKIINPDGTEAYALNRSRKALKFNFQVVSDPNPKGYAWLQSILNNA